MTRDIGWTDNLPNLSGPTSRALGTKPSWIDEFIGALLRAADANVIAVDWVYGSTGVYFSAVENVVKLGLEISRFLSKLLVSVEELWMSSSCLWARKQSERKMEEEL